MTGKWEWETDPNEIMTPSNPMIRSGKWPKCPRCGSYGRLGQTEKQLLEECPERESIEG
jgi:hypothetical protein